MSLILGIINETTVKSASCIFLKHIKISYY